MTTLLHPLPPPALHPHPSPFFPLSHTTPVSRARHDHHHVHIHIHDVMKAKEKIISVLHLHEVHVTHSQASAYLCTTQWTISR